MPQTPEKLPLDAFPELLARLRSRHQRKPLGTSIAGGTYKPRVYVAGGSGEPTEMLDTLFQRNDDEPPAAADLHFLQFPLPGINQFDFTALSNSTELSVFFMSAALKNAAPDRLHYVPIHLRRAFDYLRENPVDIALLQVARDRNGALRFAANADFVMAALSHPQTTVVAMLNEGFMVPPGAPLAIRPNGLDGSDGTFEIDYLLTGASSVPVFPGALPAGSAAPDRDSPEFAIGQYVAALVNDGDCLQTGIGAIPAAVLAALNSKTDLGFHGGLIDDAVLALIESGVMTGARKTVDAGRHIAGSVLGSQVLFEKLAHRDDVLLVGADRTHDAAVIAGIDNFVSINSAVQVDLLGQVNGEFAGGRQLSGTGGSVDFMRSARGSKGGRSIVALPATAKNGSISRIVPGVDRVTALRTDVDIVVTEYGVAVLRDQSLTERVRRLAAIAAPPFREALLAADG